MPNDGSHSEPLLSGVRRAGPARRPRLQYSVRTLLIFFALMSVVCWYIRRATTVVPDTLIEAPWAHPEQRRQYMAKLQAMSDDEGATPAER